LNPTFLLCRLFLPTLKSPLNHLFHLNHLYLLFLMCLPNHLFLRFLKNPQNLK
jgi:hypothetical protein